MAGEKSIEQIIKQNPFISGPGDLICKEIVEKLKLVPQWKQMFGDNIDAYERFDYSIRALPALRIYSFIYHKESESHYIVGEIHMDVVLPPSLRRDELQTIQDLFASALIQQFRRPTFFTELRLKLPGLNELCKDFSVDKEMGLVFDDDVLPMTRLTGNFRLDLKEWDRFLESDSRTKDEPFERTLGVLEQIVTVIQGQNDDKLKQVEVNIDQTIGE